MKCGEVGAFKELLVALKAELSWLESQMDATGEQHAVLILRIAHYSLMLPSLIQRTGPFMMGAQPKSLDIQHSHFFLSDCTQDHS